ncbi:uncharacterized protein CANTADRAFT_324155 [Suhomyces tanzawaensis NRRL Y-17324]|uniref:Uncharacterized protein n=1 Tax=Suhomyces tanzawaensis NRRL Y-17324 TaxID=984487 RepID=A0A1E4SC53_9ASCO|nr:uncharacterized protein CANTADRAFT_324155 [Suhomyces tanzawaensis NRRL Y-17324]ODV77058.1 hypothetical protein CANTADRAFT_324155 [Suhomyces tanzawaensis NRRL Y-17324]
MYDSRWRLGTAMMVAFIVDWGLPGRAPGSVAVAGGARNCQGVAAGRGASVGRVSLASEKWRCERSEDWAVRPRAWWKRQAVRQKPPQEGTQGMGWAFEGDH